MDKYFEKIKTAFKRVNYEYDNIKELLGIDIDEVDNFIDKLIFPKKKYVSRNLKNKDRLSATFNFVFPGNIFYGTKNKGIVHQVRFKMCLLRILFFSTTILNNMGLNLLLTK